MALCASAASRAEQARVESEALRGQQAGQETDTLAEQQTGKESGVLRGQQVGEESEASVTDDEWINEAVDPPGMITHDVFLDILKQMKKSAVSVICKLQITMTKF